MPNFRYTGFDERVYPQIVIPGEGSLVAHPGDERELEEDPGDGRWIAADPVKPAFQAQPAIQPEPLTVEE